MTTPTPNASPSAFPPISTTVSSPSPSSSPSATLNNSSLPSQSLPNLTSDSPPPVNSSTSSNTSSPPPQSPPQAAYSAPPPSPPQSSPPPLPPPASSPPPLPLPFPPTLPLPSSPASPPLSVNAPPPPNTTSPPPSNLVPPLPPNVASLPPPPDAPPQESLAPPVVTPPPSVAVTPSRPPPENVPSLPSINAPPPRPQTPTERSPPPPSVTPPSIDPSAAAPPPPPSGSSFSPPPVPSSSLPPPISPASPTNSSVNGNHPNSPLPSIPTEKPTASSTTPFPSSTGNASPRGIGGLNTGGVVAIGLVLSFLALSLVVMAVWYKRRKKRREDLFNGACIVPSPFASSQNSDSTFLGPQHACQLAGSYSGNNFMFSPEPGGLGNSKSWFTYEELAEATNKFSVYNLLGEGGFGSVYKGILPDGREIAVKQLKIDGGQGEREFRAEVEIISRVHHRHLVSLVGYCISEHQRLLVYDYVPNNTLHYHLHGEDRPVMDWATRVKVAAGAARGIAYLHEDCNPRIIHRDIKSSNILLDNNFEAQVADFGLAKLALDADTHVTTRVMGTFGYLAPEYASTGKLTEKSDVFSFGVVLLELITGRKPVDTSQPLGDESLVGWARPLLTQALDSENFEELIDPRLEKNFVENEMFRMVEAAAACVRHLASKRPRMSQVVRALDSIAELSDLTNGMKPGQSEVFNSREQAAQIRIFQRMLVGSQDYGSDLLSHSQSGWRSQDSTTNVYQQL